MRLQSCISDEQFRIYYLVIVRFKYFYTVHKNMGKMYFCNNILAPSKPKTSEWSGSKWVPFFEHENFKLKILKKVNYFDVVHEKENKLAYYFTFLKSTLTIYFKLQMSSKVQTYCRIHHSLNCKEKHPAEQRHFSYDWDVSWWVGFHH